jgi:hypothetical protein
MVIQELAPRGARFSTSGSIVAGNDTPVCSDPCAPSEDFSTVAGNGSWDNAHTFDPSNRGERPNKELVLSYNAHNV